MATSIKTKLKSVFGELILAITIFIFVSLELNLLYSSLETAEDWTSIMLWKSFLKQTALNSIIVVNGAIAYITKKLLASVNEEDRLLYLNELKAAGSQNQALSKVVLTMFAAGLNSTDATVRTAIAVSSKDLIDAGVGLFNATMPIAIPVTPK